ncbi:MAG: DMT family transporter [Pseudomonadota bacterium]
MPLARAVPYFTNSGAIMLLIATFFWGGNAVAGKLANGEVSPMLLTGFRWWLAGAFLYPFAHQYLKRDWPIIRKHFLYLLMLAPLGFTVFNVLLYVSLTYTTALNVTIEQSAMPLFIFIINFLFFRVKPYRLQIFGYLFTLLGVVLVVSGGSVERLMQLTFNIGDVIMLFAAFSYAAFSVGLSAKPQMHWLSFLTVLVFIAAVTSVPFVLYEMTTDKFIWPHSSLGWGIVAFAAIVPSVICQAAFIRGNEILGPNKAALFLNLVPIFGAFLSVMILGEDLRWFHLVAMVLVLGGIFIARQAKPTQE